MSNITWEINESFIFPEAYGRPVKTEEIKVVPRWEQQIDDLSLQVSGIYHVSAYLEFDKEKERAKQLSNDCTLIDDVEWRDDKGYFEYAIAFDVSLPKEVVQSSIQLDARDVKVELQDDGICHVNYQVDCHYDEVKKEQPEILVQSTESTASADLLETPIELNSEESILSEFLWDLEEHYTTVEIPLNDIGK
ncbi:hypothetical protein [Rummeliibacillus suwonensis]|uniref:hypothetical protein n=1 Tax=Rummeliibacillus suwonensis TaxID=1306154 RepID=UPI0011B6061F|nr:hypothetical protein [Rummeliibacillus suwonensis]MBO2537476.1 hypothetical protein [Rummeliibacillus suwonensis]